MPDTFAITIIFIVLSTVVAALIRGRSKDYPADFIEIMDVNYRVKEGQSTRKADLVVLRKYGIIRHLGE